MSRNSNYTGNLVGDTQPYSYATLQRMLTAAEIRISRLEQAVAVLTGKKSGSDTGSVTDVMTEALKSSSSIADGDGTAEVSTYEYKDGKLKFSGKMKVKAGACKLNVPKLITPDLYSSETIKGKIFLTNAEASSEEQNVIGEVLVQRDGIYFTVTDETTAKSTTDVELHFVSGVPATTAEATKVKLEAVDSPSGIFAKN